MRRVPTARRRLRACAPALSLSLPLSPSLSLSPSLTYTDIHRERERLRDPRGLKVPSEGQVGPPPASIRILAILGKPLLDAKCSAVHLSLVSCAQHAFNDSARLRGSAVFRHVLRSPTQLRGSAGPTPPKASVLHCWSAHREIYSHAQTLHRIPCLLRSPHGASFLGEGRGATEGKAVRGQVGSGGRGHTASILAPASSSA